MKNVLVAMMLVLVGCVGVDDDPRCGAGTVERGGECVAGDGDADADSDGDGDGDGDGDADGDADADADSDADGDGDGDGDLDCDEDQDCYPDEDGNNCTVPRCSTGVCIQSHEEDQDGDGYTSIDCGGIDCDDRNPDINPELPEIPGDGIDQDCDGADGANPDTENMDATCSDRSDNDDDGYTDCDDSDCDGTAPCSG